MILTSNFIQGDDCVIVDYLNDNVEISTGSPEKYKDWEVEYTEQELFELRMERCLDRRIKAYSKLNQLELIADDAINGTTAFADSIAAIKEKYPKPE